MGLHQILEPQNGSTAVSNHWGFEVLEHLPYSPDLTPSDYHLFGLLKDALRGREFSTDKEVREAVHKWLRDQPKTFFLEGIRKFVDHWTKCIKKEGDCRKMTYLFNSYFCVYINWKNKSVDNF
jgi:hypothetical protein